MSDENMTTVDDVVFDRIDAELDRGEVEYVVKKLKSKGEIYEPQTDHYRGS